MKEKIKLALMSICSVAAFGVNAKTLFANITKFKNGAINNGLSIGLIGVVILFIFFYKLYLLKKPKKNKSITVLSVIFGLLMVFGFSYVNNGTSSLVFGNILKFLFATVQFLGYFFVFRIGLTYVFAFLENYKFKI